MPANASLGAMNRIDSPAGTAAVAAVARPLRRDAARNQAGVLIAAREVISEFGVAASMEQVAARAGVGVGTLYRHYPNKQALVDELVQALLADLVTIARAELTESKGAGLERFLRSFGESLARHHGYSAHLVSPGESDRHQELAAAVAALHREALAHDRISPDVTVGDVRALMWALRGIIAVTGQGAPDAWHRHLDLHLAALRIEPTPSRRPAVTEEELQLISHRAAGRTPQP